MAPFLQSGVTMVFRFSVFCFSDGVPFFLFLHFGLRFQMNTFIRKTMSVAEKHLNLCVFKRNLTNVKRPSASRGGKLL